MATTGVLERRKATVLKYVLAGCSDAQVASLVARRGETISPQAVTQWRERHASELSAVKAEVDRQTIDYAIASQVNRIANKDMLRSLLEDVRQARAKGEQGMETGLVVRTFKGLGSGENFNVVEEYKIDDGLLAAIERLESSAADELGQKTRPDQNINLRAAVIVREYVGIDPAQVG